MTFCTKCGASIDNNTNVCPNCGAPQQTTANNSNTYVNPAPVSMDGTDYTSTMDPNDIAQNKAMAVLSYLGILFLIPILSAPNSPYARFHSNQGIILFIAGFIYGVAGGVLSVIPFVGSIFFGAFGLLIFVFTILGIFNAASGKAKELPLIGKIRIIK